MDLQRLHNARRLDEEEFDNQKQVLQAQLQREVSLIAVSKCAIYIFFSLAQCCLTLESNNFGVFLKSLSLWTACVKYDSLDVCVQMERSAQLRAQLVESEEKAKWMDSYVQELKMQLHQTQQGTR